MTADARLDPDAVHPLNSADCIRSQARLADIELGLSVADDAGFWRDKAQQRIEALEYDAYAFGLMPHEEAELDQLKSMLARPNQRLQPTGGRGA